MCCTPSRNNKRHLPRARDALECVATLARTREDRQNCVRFAYRGPQVDRLHVLELKRDVWNDVRFELKHRARMGAT